MEDRFALDEGAIRKLRSLQTMYQAPKSVFLNFYGPPGTIMRLSYIDVLSSMEDPQREKVFDFMGKAVFIGAVDLQLLGQKDSFHAVFSQPDGTDFSGVQIAAAAFADFLESPVVRPVQMPSQLAEGKGFQALVPCDQIAIGCATTKSTSRLLSRTRLIPFRNWSPGFSQT
jgi:adenylate cyclase